MAATLSAQPAHLIFVAGNVELSPPQTLTRTAVSLPTEQLVGVASGWAIVETRHDACEGRGDGSPGPAKQRWILGPGAIHTVDAVAGPCQVSSDRRLRQIFDGLASCGSDCAFTVTVASGGGAGAATEALFLELLQTSPLAKAKPRPTDALGLTETVVSKAPSICERYAASAVAQQVENVTKGCGMSGSGWSDEPAGHLRFCEQVERRRADLERRRASRRRVLERCSPRSLSPECAEYAAGAAALQDGNLWHGCGFEGRDWNADFDTHYEWCTTATNRDLRLQVLGVRQAKVAACAAR